jgi:nitroreductase
VSYRPDIEALTAALPSDKRAVGEAIATRRSVRGFKPDPVSQETVEAILALAARAPSGSNIQPWHVYVCAGEKRDEVVRAVSHAFETEPEKHDEPYRYYPMEWREPYIGRRRATGWGLYGAVGVEKGDKAGMHAQRAKNYTFFGAPVGLFFAMDKDMERGSWLDIGTFIQTVMIAARGFDLDTCAQQAWSHYWKVVHPIMGIPDNQILVSGMALGHIDEAEKANTFWTEREPVAKFATFEGF